MGSKCAVMLVLAVTSAVAGAVPAAADITPTRDAQALAQTLDVGTVTGAGLPFSPPAPGSQAECDNGQDDDGDGLTDFAPATGAPDPGCATASDNQEQDDAPSQCSNGSDDDGDGFVDFSPPLGQTADTGCASAQDDNEVDGGEDPVAACANGADDDGDGLVDLADAGCAGSDDLDESSEGLPLGGDANATAIGTAPLLAGFPTAGSEYLVLSSGSAAFADDANDSDSTGQTNGDAPGSESHGSEVRDLVQLRVDFTVPEGANCARLTFRFLSEEFPEFVGSAYNDGFVAELDASDFQATTDSITAPRNFAFDAAGRVVSINTTGFAAGEAAGTTYDGATPLLRASVPITSGPHSIYLSVFDLSDSVLDSSVFVDHLRLVSVPEGTCVTGASSDDIPPDTVITEGPAGAVPGPTATFAFTSSEPSGGGFQCRIDAAPFRTCSSPHVTAALGSGAHAFEVRAVDAAGNVDPTPARRDISIGSAPERADLSVDVSDPTKGVRAGREYSYVFTVRNAGPGAARNVVLRGDLPSDTAFVYTKGAEACSGTGDVRCSLGTIPAGGSVPVEVRMQTGQVRPKGGSSRRLAASATSKSRLTAEAAVTSDAIDPDAANDTETEKTALKTATVDFEGRRPKRSAGRGRRAAAAALSRPTWGWHASDSRNEWWSALGYRGFATGGAYGHGQLQTMNQGFQYNVATPVFKTYLDTWQAIDFQLQVWKCWGYSTSCSTSEWTTVKDSSGLVKPTVGPDVTGGPENPGLGKNPFWRIRTKRTPAKTQELRSGLVRWNLGTPGEAYRLRSRWTYWRDRVGPRDEVHQTNWVVMSSVRTG